MVSRVVGRSTIGAFVVVANTLGAGCCARDRCAPACAPVPVAADSRYPWSGEHASTDALPRPERAPPAPEPSPVPPFEVQTERRAAAVPEGFGVALGAIRKEPDAAAKRRAIVALHAKEPSAFLALGARNLAALAPEVLAVYDVSAALAEGGDGVEPQLDPTDWGKEPTAPAACEEPAKEKASGRERRATRIADEVRTAIGAGDGVLVAVRVSDDPMRPTFVVVASDAAGFARAEEALGRVATIGGPVVRVTFDLLRASDATGSSPVDVERTAAPTPSSNPSPSNVRALSEAPDEAALAPRRIAQFEAHATLGRSVATWRTARTAYVQDYDVEAGNSSSYEALIGELLDGFSASASLVVRDGAAPALAVDAAWTQLVRPMPVFLTMLATTSTSPVTIELPELRVFRAKETLALADGRGVWAVGPGSWLLIRAETVDAGAPVVAGWRRLSASDPSSTFAAEGPRPVVTVSLMLIENATGTTFASTEISVLAGQQGSFGATDEWSYVSRYRVDSRGRADPTVEKLGRGFDVEFTPVFADAGRAVIDGRAVSRRVAEPMRSARVSLQGPAAAGDVILPVVHEASRPFRVSLARDETARLPMRVSRRGEPSIAVTLAIRFVGVVEADVARPK